MNRGDAQILKNIKKGATVERARDFTRDTQEARPGRPRRLHHRTAGRDARDHRAAPSSSRKNSTSRRSKSRWRTPIRERNCYEFAKENGFILHATQMVDDGGHQLAQIEYPGLPREEALDAVHRFYDEYYFRPKAVFRIVRKAILQQRGTQAAVQGS